MSVIFEEEQRSAVSATTLNIGLRWALWGLMGIIVLASGASTVAVFILNREVESWSAIESLDTARETLQAEVARHVSARDPGSFSETLKLFDDMAAEVGSLNDGLADPENSGLRGRVETARALLFNGEALANDAERVHASLIADIDRLQGVSGDWAPQLRDRRDDTAKDLAVVETRQRMINDELALLTETMLAAGRVQRQLDAGARLIATSGDLALSAIANLDTADLPEPCSSGAQTDGIALCEPSIARVRGTLGALKTANAEQLVDAVKQADWALEAYVRVGEGRYRHLSQTLTASLDTTQSLRARVDEAAILESALNRLNRFLIEARSGLGLAILGGTAADGAAQVMPFVIGNLKTRMEWFLRDPDLATPEFDEMSGILAGLSQKWDRLRAEIEARDRTFAEYDAKMEQLAYEISWIAVRKRSTTTKWVSVFATTAFGAALLLVLTVIGSVWLARRHFVQPLMQVTSNLLDLARGNLNRSLRLPQKLFGFDQLGMALEALRLAMLERVALAEHNVEQKSIIKANLHQLEQTTQEMQWLAMHDPLTGLGNRRKADIDLAALTLRSRETDVDFSLLHIDVDNFKEINDSLGHEAGNSLLRHVAAQLNEIAGETGKCYRIGGDEFLIALEGAPCEAELVGLATYIVAELSQPIEYKGRLLLSGVSLGIASGRDADGDAAATLVNADFALYEAKRAGRNAFRFFDTELRLRSHMHRTQADELMAAIEAEAFVPVYQPQYYAQTLRLRGVETLCRWLDPERGWIAPKDFLPLAEELKVLGKIDQIVFRKAAEDMRRLRNMGFRIPKISFNITADRLLYANLATDLVGAFDKDVRIAVELLESMSLDSLTNSVRSSIDQLKKHGIAIEIDDFGSCRASVAGLVAVGPDAMKIDCSIIMPLTYSPRHLKLVRAIIEIGKALGIEVIAEGVETEEHIEILTALKCDVLQGFALAMPMSADGLVDLLRNTVPGVGGPKERQAGIV